MTHQSITLIAASDLSWCIGLDGKLPWHMPADLARFKAATMGKPIIMGRKTHESIGRALPGRQNIVMTHQSDMVADGCVLASSVASALETAGDVDEIMIIGGASIYGQFMELADRILITVIHYNFHGDTFFPWNMSPTRGVWHIHSHTRYAADAKNAYSCSVLDCRRSKRG